MSPYSAKRKHDDDEGERAPERDQRPRIDTDGEKEHRAVALPLATRAVRPVDDTSGDDSSETYCESSSSEEESDESEDDSDDDEVEEPEREVERVVEKEIIIGQQQTVATSYSDPDGITVLRAGSKPKIDMSFGQQSSILSRVQAFLPELDAANRKLAAESNAELYLSDDQIMNMPHVELVGLALIMCSTDRPERVHCQ
jgi:hypothetical protein